MPAGEPWLALPVNRLLVENRAEPEAMAACRPPVCGPGLAVGVLRVTGRDAEAAASILREPGRLARALAAKAPSRTAATAKPLEAGAARGFTLALSRRDGSKSAYGAVLGGRAGPDLRLVLVIGEDPESVEATARSVAREHLGS